MIHLLIALITCTFSISAFAQMEFVAIQPGTFVMGNAAETCNPVRTVQVMEPFEISKFEVTQEEYVEVMATNPSGFNFEFYCPGQFSALPVPFCKNLPVESVLHDEAMEFTAKLTRLRADGYVYRLPTETEWEYAARAGSQANFWYGDHHVAGKDVHHGESVRYHDGNRYHAPLPVGTGEANPWGLYNMHGNVRELMLETRGCRADEPTMKSIRWTRGGDFFWAPSLGTSWATSNSRDDQRWLQVGIRLVRTKIVP